MTIRSVVSLEELADAFDLAGEQLDPVIDRSDEGRYGELRVLERRSKRDASTHWRGEGVPPSRSRGELLRAFERAVVRIGAKAVTLGADEATGFYVRHGYQTLLLLQWVYAPQSFEAEAAALLQGPLRGMAHEKASFNGVPQLFVTLDEPNPSMRAQIADQVEGAHVGYCMRRDLA